MNDTAIRRVAKPTITDLRGGNYPIYQYRRLIAEIFRNQAIQQYPFFVVTLDFTIQTSSA